MNDIETAIYSRLTGFAGLSALVGTRVYPLVIPQDVGLPAIAYQRISTHRVRSLAGASGLARPRFQFTVVDDDADGARAVVKQLRLALDGYRDMGADPQWQAAWVENEVQQFSDVSDLYSVMLDAFVWHCEDV